MKILLADDHPLFLEGLKTLLTVRGFEVVGTASDGIEAMEKAKALRPEVILMDIHMPRLNGLAATRLIKSEWPEAKIVILTISENDEDLFEAIRSGACGYLIKTEDTARFFDLLAGLARGEAALSPGLAGRVLEEFARGGKGDAATERPAEKDEPLTPRQVEILTLVAEGMTYKQVGAKLFLTEHTIKYHMGRIIEKLHFENRRTAVEYARGMNRERA
jgi:DNA-binding NarL/FixJ family response regulator